VSVLLVIAAQGLAFGMLLQIAVGPVCLGVLQKGLAGKLRPALLMVVGVALADALYIALAMLGVAALFEVGALRVALALGGAVTLAYFGWRTIRSAADPVRPASGGDSGLGSLRYGFLLTLTNPLTALFWTGVFAGLAASSFGADRAAAIAFGAGCVAATLVFLSVVAASGAGLARALSNPRALGWLNRGVGVCLIVFAIKLALDGVA
jgi:threonine/homoserine/homoserine lactone efflux protein